MMHIIQDLNRFKEAQNESWYDWSCFESIQTKLEGFCDTIQAFLIRFKLFWSDSHKSETLCDMIQAIMNRFRQ